MTAELANGSLAKTLSFSSYNAVIDITDTSRSVSFVYGD